MKMLNKLALLKDNFNTVIEIRKNVKIIFEILQQRINKLKQFYHDFIVDNNNNQIFIFGLDSFYFQSKIIDLEYEDMKRLFLAMNNRIYCEYYKLHKIIVYYIKENINEKKILESLKMSNYPTYKDLEPFKEYDIELINDIHENVFDLILQILTFTEHKERELLIITSKKNIGLNIDNFVNTFSYDIVVMKEKINLFIKYIEFFHKLHIKYFKKLSNKIQLMYNDVSSDINFEEQIITEERINYNTEQLKNEINQIAKAMSIDENDINNNDNNNDILNESINGSVSISNIDSNDGNNSETSSEMNTAIKNENANDNNVDINNDISNNIFNDNLLNNINDNIPEKKNLKLIFKKNVNKITALNRLKNIHKNNSAENIDVNNVVNSINDVYNSFINHENDNETNIVLKMVDEIEKK